MSDCKQNEIPGMLLGASTEQENREIRAHMETCSLCRELYQELSPAVNSLLSEVPLMMPSKNLKKDLMSKVQKDEKLFAAAAAPEKSKSKRFGFGFATALGLVLLALFLVPQQSSPRTLTADVDSKAAPSGKAALVISDNQTLRVSGMPSAGRGRIYQVWLKRGNKIEPTDALFGVRKGQGSVVVPEKGDTTEVLVTSEPEGGSDAPTRNPILAVTV